jgi:hypothetical protein
VIAGAAALNVSLTDRQKIAGDVSGNGQITSYDAGIVARKTVAASCLGYKFPVRVETGSDWAFLPEERKFDPLMGGENYDFIGIYYEGQIPIVWAPRAPGAGQVAPSVDVNR